MTQTVAAPCNCWCREGIHNQQAIFRQYLSLLASATLIPGSAQCTPERQPIDSVRLSARVVYQFGETHRGERQDPVTL